MIIHLWKVYVEDSFFHLPSDLYFDIQIMKFCLTSSHNTSLLHLQKHNSISLFFCPLCKTENWGIGWKLFKNVIFSLFFQVMQEDQGLETSTIGLRFKVRDKHFKNGDLKLKCTAVIATIYWKSNEESVQGVRPQSALVSESRSSRNSGK